MLRTHLTVAFRKVKCVNPTVYSVTYKEKKHLCKVQLVKNAYEGASCITGDTQTDVS
jgi:hypothetical protein